MPSGEDGLNSRRICEKRGGCAIALQTFINAFFSVYGLVKPCEKLLNYIKLLVLPLTLRENCYIIKWIDLLNLEEL